MVGLEKHRPVILPLPRGGGFRCSVKPASRGPLHSRNNVTQAFARVTRFNSRLGTGRPEISISRPDTMGWTNVPSP
ncbi:hypothetical protein SLA2020_066590 [Shorea laevis]